MCVCKCACSYISECDTDIFAGSVRLSVTSEERITSAAEFVTIRVLLRKHLPIIPYVVTAYFLSIYVCINS